MCIRDRSPNFDSINGTIVVDGTISPPLGAVKNPITFTIEKGYITKIEGAGTDANEYAAWMKSFEDKQIYLVAHGSFGFGPNAKLNGDIVEDERVWGCTEWGFGNVGPQLVSDIPGGIPAPTHSDGICLNCSCLLYTSFLYFRRIFCEECGTDRSFQGAYSV